MADIIYSTISICPECHQRIPADYIEEDGQVFMVKDCPDHGHYKDLVSINAKHFRWIQQFKMDSEAKMCTTQTKIDKGCPLDCGICEFHKSAPAIAIVDITYRCNLKCPICYAAALNEKGKNIEPTLEELRTIYQHFREIKPTGPVCCMYAGGEPTVRDDFPEIIAMTRELGYLQRQVASNGIRFAKDINFLADCIDAGLNAIYFQFDGIGDAVYEKTRGAKLWKLKQKVIENCRELDFPNVCLVPTIAKGVNDDQIPQIIDYAIENIDVISVISFQPVSLCGRISEEERTKLRITSSHVIKAVNEYTNGETGWMYPMVALDKFAKVAAWMSGVSEELELTCHPNCGFGTFLFVDPKNKQYRDITKLFKVKDFLRISDKWYRKILAKRQGKIRKYRDIFNFGPISRTLGSFIDRGEDAFDKARFAAELLTTMKNPLIDGIDNFTQRARLFLNTMLNSSQETSANWLIKGNNLLIAMMHFQDGYNMDVERASRCLVHYGYIDPKTKTVKAVPFCPMNTIHRERIENELLMAQAVTKKEKIDVPIPEVYSGN
ncbi:MAG: radical SAM protein [Candidatus Helarchaeota archaeon]